MEKRKGGTIDLEDYGRMSVEGLFPTFISKATHSPYQGGVMGHDHVLNIESGTVANSPGVPISDKTSVRTYLIAAGPPQGMVMN